MARAEQFLDAFADIERELRRLTGEGRDTSFAHLINLARSSNAVVSRNADDLREFADLRNAIVHERRDGVPIADPREDAVNGLEGIRDLLLRPPLVTPLLGQVITCKPDDSVGYAARLMFEGDFSQLPVYSDDGWRDLLTSETIARWLSSKLEDDIGILEEEAVEDVLVYREDSSREVFKPRDTTVFDVLDTFDEFSHSGLNLDALLITETGRKEQQPLGILTVFDLPAIYRLASGIE